MNLASHESENVERPEPIHDGVGMRFGQIFLLLVWGAQSIDFRETGVNCVGFYRVGHPSVKKHLVLNS